MSEVAIIDRGDNVVPLRTGGKIAGIVPTSIEEVFRLANAVAKSGLAPSTLRTSEALTVAIMHGLELGLTPMAAIQNIAVVNGRPTIWGMGVPALLLARGFKLKEWIDGTDDGRAANCCVTRPDGTEIERRFSVGDAKTAGLWGKAGPWKQYPDRMLQMRARGLAARDGAADVLSGLYLDVELQDIDVRPQRKSSAECKRDGTKNRFDGIRRQIAEATSVEQVERIREDNAAEIATMAAGWADLVNGDIETRLRDLAADPVDQAAVLREIERTLDGKPAAEVEREFAGAIMAMDEDGRAAALDMIEAAKS